MKQFKLNFNSLLAAKDRSYSYAQILRHVNAITRPVSKKDKWIVQINFYIVDILDLEREGNRMENRKIPE